MTDFDPTNITGKYILDDQGEPVEERDLLKWALWMEANDRHVCQDYDEGDGDKKVWVSTVFLGIDYRHCGGGPPILWETLVFGGPLDGEQKRYTSKLDAVRGHQAMCQRVSAAQELLD